MARLKIPFVQLALLAALGLALGLAASVTDASAASSDGADASGHAVYRGGTFRDIDLSFVAKDDPGGNVVFKDGLGQTFNADVDCFVAIDDDTIACSGALDATNTNNPAWYGFNFILYVHDGGPGATHDWFRITFQSDNCEDFRWTTDAGGVPAAERWALVRGNISVR